MAHDVSNIGPRGVRGRRIAGVAALAGGVAAAVALIALDAPRLARLVVLPVFVFGLLGVLQARERVCVALASRGVRDLDAGEEPVGDASLDARLRAVARRTWATAILAGLAVTAAVYACPS